MTLRDKLRLFTETDPRPRSFKLLTEEMRSKGAVGFRPLSLLDSLRLDIALFFHKYFAATLCVALLLAGGSAWITFLAFGPSSPAAMRVQASTVIPPQVLGVSARLQEVSIATVNSHTKLSTQSLVKNETPASANTDLLQTSGVTVAEEPAITIVEPKRYLRVMLGMAFVPIGVGVEPLRISDPPLDYSGFTASVSYEQPGIPANPNFAGTNENDLSYQAGYRFDQYQEAGIGYSRHIYRQISSTTEAILVLNPGTGQTTVVHETILHNSDNSISLPESIIPSMPTIGMSWVLSHLQPHLRAGPARDFSGAPPPAWNGTRGIT